MRYRQLSPTGDYLFGNGLNDFLINSPAAVGQAVLTALKLFAGEWFLNTLAGVPWRTEVLGKYTSTVYDTIIKDAILAVQGVTGISAYSSTLNNVTRVLSVQATIDTIYGQTDIATTI
jgi:hypothetical protein